jgi:hypothetical protein
LFWLLLVAFAVTLNHYRWQQKNFIAWPKKRKAVARHLNPLAFFRDGVTGVTGRDAVFAVDVARAVDASRR